MKFDVSNSSVYLIKEILKTNYVPNKDLLTELPAKRGYQPFKYIENRSKNFVSNTSYYDSDTHEALGDYLRAYRDIYNINLMEFYNCFSNRFISSFNLPITIDNNVIVGSDISAKVIVFAFPIRFDTQYDITLPIDASNICVQPAFYNKQKLLTLNIEGFRPFLVKYPTSSKFTYSLDEVAANYMPYESELYLFIQCTTQLASAIKGREVVPGHQLAGNNSLFDNTQYSQIPFSDILINYLSGNVITPADCIKQNIAKVQRLVFNNAAIAKKLEDRGIIADGYAYQPGYYDDKLKECILELYAPSQVAQYAKTPDCIGFVDKNIEKKLEEGAVVPLSGEITARGSA